MLIDTREQLELLFQDEFITECERVPLPVGDYSCEFKNGYQCPVCFERKSLNDLFGTLSKGYDRFKREIERAKSLDIKLIIVIEGTLTDVLWGIKHSERSGISVLRQLFTLWIKHGVPFYCLKDRTEMSIFITEYFKSIGRKALKDLKEGKK